MSNPTDSNPPFDSTLFQFTDTSTWTIENISPIANDSFKITAGTPLLATVESGDHDADGDSLTFNLLSNGPFNGSVTLNPNGRFAYISNPDFAGVDSFDYVIVDANGATAMATVKISVLSADELPVVENPRTDHDGLESFENEISDSNGASDIAVVTIAATPVSDSPVAEIELFTTKEDAPLKGTVAANDGRTLTFQLLTAPNDGELSFNADGSFTFISNQNFVGTTTFEYETCDENFVTVAATATIEVTPINNAPISLDDSELTDEDSIIIVNLLGNDQVPENESIKVIEIIGVKTDAGDTITLPSGAMVTLNSDRTATYNPNGQYDDLLSGQAALDTFVCTTSDGNGKNTVTETVIMINGQNDIPITEDDYVKTPVDTPVLLNVLGDDYDPESQALAVVLLNQPWSGHAVVNPDGTVLYTPDPEFEGSVTIHYLVEDPDGATNDATITIEVEPLFQFDSFTNFSD